MQSVFKLPLALTVYMRSSVARFHSISRWAFCKMIAVFITDSTADEATRESVIARIAKLAYDESLETR